jgi:thiamine biosynthesis lipoprotein
MRHNETVMGTVVSFDVRCGDRGDAAAERAITDACARLHELDGIFSTWKADSAISRIRRGELDVGDAPAEVADVLELCAQAREMSGGFFDPWALPGGVDPTGLVKGWAAEQALDVIRASGASAAMVNAGGDIAVFGRPSADGWRIGVTDPRRTGDLLCVAQVDAAIATSGAYERGAHIIDPMRRAPSALFDSATAVGPSLALVDALATALVAGGVEVLKAVTALPGYGACVLTGDGVLRATADFPVAEAGHHLAAVGRPESTDIS